MTGPQQTEVAVIERRELRFIETFGHGQHGSVNEPDIGVCISITELTDTAVIAGGQALDLIRPGLHVGEQCHEDARTETAMNQVVDFHQNRGGNDKRLRGILDEPPTRGVSVVAAIE